MNIKRIDIVHHSHWNPSAPDHPTVAWELQKQYLDRALDIIAKNSERGDDDCFRWSVEGFLPLLEWWAEADRERRDSLVHAVKNGWIDIGGFPGNMSPFVTASEWDYLFGQIPEELQTLCRLRTVMQSGTGGISSQGMIRAYKKGVRYLWANESRYTDGRDISPRYFNWKLTAYQRAFVWVNPSYGNACSLLFGTPSICRKRNHTNPAFLVPGDAFPFSFQKEVLEKVQAGLLDRLEHDPVYRDVRHSTLPVSFTDLAGSDNDPPQAWLSDFVAAWNRFGFQPRLRLSTMTQAVASVEVEVLNNKLPTLTGEWADDHVRPFLHNPDLLQRACELRRKLLQTGFLSVSVAAPLHARTLSGLTRFCLAQDGATTSFGSDMMDENGACLDFLLANGLRSRFSMAEKGIYLTNPSLCTYSDWVLLPVSALPSEIQSLRNSEDGQKIPLFFSGETVRFWAELLPGKTIRFLPDSEICSAGTSESPEICTDEYGFPRQICWNGKTVLSVRSFGEFSAERLPEGVCRFQKTECEIETPETVCLKQFFSHPYLKQASRSIQIWKQSPRVRITFDLEYLDILPVDSCRITFWPDTGKTPAILSNAGSIFEPVRGEVNDTVCERYATDGWIAYPYANLLFSTPDLPVVLFCKQEEDGYLRGDYGEAFSSCVYDPDGTCRPLHQVLRYEFSVEPGLDDFETLIAGFPHRFYPLCPVVRL